MKVKIGRGKVKIVKHRLKKKEKRSSKKMDAEGGGMLANSSLSTLHFFYLPPVSLSFNRIRGLARMKYRCIESLV